MDNQIKKNEAVENENEYATPFNIDFISEDEGQIKKYFSQISQLPNSLKILFIDFSTAEFIEDRLGPQFQLSPDQKKEITKIIRDIIIPKIYLGDLVKTVQEKLKIDEVKAREVANFIFTNLFSKEALEELKKLHVVKFGQTRQISAPQNLSGQESVSTRKPESINNPNVIDLRNKPGE